MESRTYQVTMEINPENSHQTSSMKHHLPETHEHNFEKLILCYPRKVPVYLFAPTENLMGDLDWCACHQLDSGLLESPVLVVIIPDRTSPVEPYHHRLVSVSVCGLAGSIFVLPLHLLRPPYHITAAIMGLAAPRPLLEYCSSVQQTWAAVVEYNICWVTTTHYLQHCSLCYCLTLTIVNSVEDGDSCSGPRPTSYTQRLPVWLNSWRDGRKSPNDPITTTTATP